VVDDWMTALPAVTDPDGGTAKQKSKFISDFGKYNQRPSRLLLLLFSRSAAWCFVQYLLRSQLTTNKNIKKVYNS
jgi:hypothetical protein